MKQQVNNMMLLPDYAEARIIRIALSEYIAKHEDTGDTAQNSIDTAHAVYAEVAKKLTQITHFKDGTPVS